MDDGKKENAGAFLSLFPHPIVPRALSLSPVLSLPTTRRGFCVGEGPRFINLSANDDILLGEGGGGGVTLGWEVAKLQGVHAISFPFSF